jgi:hypothetical protein
VVDLLALGMAAGALAMLILALSMIAKGRLAPGLVVGVLALVVGGVAGSLAAFA